jgi:mono/diheme cytochrome c family protein
MNLDKQTLNSAATVEIESTQPPSPKQNYVGWLILIVAIATSGLLCSLLLWHPSDLYTQAVLNLDGNPTKGRSIFVMNCVDCHGQWADGKVGPSLRGVSDKLSPAKLVHQVVSGDTPPMPQFQPQPQEMADLLSYLQQL